MPRLQDLGAIVPMQVGADRPSSVLVRLERRLKVLLHNKSVSIPKGRLWLRRSQKKKRPFWKFLLKLMERSVPFQGNTAIENQVGPFVFQWRNDGGSWGGGRLLITRKSLIMFGKFQIWVDSVWRS